jgi:uncharacterized membrane protein YfhO
MPRAFLVHQAEVPGSDEAMVALLTGEEFDLSSSILLEEREALDRLAGMAEGTSTLREESDVNIVEYEPNRVVVEVSTNQPGFLFLSDSHHPGWRAFVDGEVETVYRADYLFRAVLVPPGQHRVEFRFDPVAFKLGSVVSLFAALVLVATAFVSTKKGRSTTTAGNGTSQEPRPRSS